MRGFLRLLGRLGLSLALGLGWLALLVVAGLWITERTGLLRDFVLEALRAQAGALAADLSLEDARLEWFEPALELEGLALGRDGEYALVRRVRVELVVERGLGVRIERIDAAGGHLRIAPALRTALEGFTRDLSPTATPPPGEPPPPGLRLTVRDIDLDWETERWGRLPIGRADVDFDFDPVRGAEIDGRLRPYLAPLPGTGRPTESGVITVRGRAAGAGSFEVDAWAQGVPLSMPSIPSGTVLDALVPWDPRGLLALELNAAFSVDGSMLPRATARARVSAGSVVLPRSTAPVDDVELAFEARYAPTSEAEVSSPRAWTGRGLVQGRWDACALRAWSVLGGAAGDGLFGKVWVAADELGLDARIAELLGPSGRPREKWNAFEPRGPVDALAAIEVPATWSAGEELFSAARTALFATTAGRAGLTYHGWPNLPGGASDQGFPLPIDGVHGEVGYALDPRALRRFRIGLFDLGGEHGSGPITARGYVQAHPIDAPPTLPGHGESEIDLTLASPSLAVDERLKRALIGLRGDLPPEKTWAPFFPGDGELRIGKLSVDLRLKREVDMSWLATDLRLGLDGLAMEWEELPLPATDVRGELRFRSDGRLQRELGVAARGRLGTARGVSLALRTGVDPTSAAAASGRKLDELQVIAIDVQALSCKGKDATEIAARVPGVGDALARAAPRGFLDAHLERVRERAGGPLHLRAEVSPAAGEQVELQFAQFPMRTEDVRGRVLVGLVEDPRTGTTTTRVDIAPLLGRWTGNVQVAFTAGFPESIVRVMGAGIDPASSSLRGSIATLLGNTTPGSEPDISAVGLSGRVDFGGELRLAEADGERTHSRFTIHMRENLFRSGQNFALDALRGALVLEDGVLQGERLEARLADTPVVLQRVGFRTTPEGFVFDTDLAANGLPIDRRHLLAFADAKTVDALLDELKWAGKLDVREGHVTVSGPRTGDTRLVFRGTIVPSAMTIVLGLPLTVRTAEARIDELVIEGGTLRTRARVVDFSGLVAGRKLEDAEMVLTYHEPRLSIEDLTGQFAGGRLRPLGAGSYRGGTLFTIDLVEPYPFELAIDLADVKIEELLQGLFVSNVASKGRLKAGLRLTGDQDNVLRMRGSGAVLLTETYLWSVPVIRTLLETVQLGNTVTFDSMATNLEIEDGRVHMRDIRVASDALQLAGKGTLDFDGTLDYDLDVKLSEIRNLQWLLRLFSWITDNIVSVSIHGDLDRPDISAHWFGIFGRKDGFRALPLPGYAPLPPRF